MAETILKCKDLHKKIGKKERRCQFRGKSR